jgi:hypothetical protein
LINEYQLENNVELRVATVISQNVRFQLLAHHPKYTPREFELLPNEKIIQLIQLHVRPQTQLKFRMIISENVQFNISQKYTPTASNYQIMYSALVL